MNSNIKSYKATVPDTLDLAERAELGLHGIANTTDPANEYMMWFQISWNKRPPYMLHNACDVECTPKFLDNLTQLRIMCGSDKYLDIENGMNDALLSHLSKDDGLYYALYKPNRPWNMYHIYSDVGYTVSKEDYMEIFVSGLFMTVLILRNELYNGLYTDQINALARGLEKASIKREDYAYYPEDFKNYTKDGRLGLPFTRPRNAGWATDEEPYDEHAGGEGAVICYFGHQIRGLSMWADRTGDEQALEFAGKLVRFIMRPNFWGNPVEPPLVAGCEQGHVDSHFHARAHALRGILEYGIVSGNSNACDFVRSSYEYMRTYGINRIGWIPTWPNAHLTDPHRTMMEGCFLGDALALIIKLSDAGLGDYWEDADRFIRNHLVEAQFTRKDLIERVIENSPEFILKDAYPGQVCYDNIAERMLGIFGSFLTPTSIYDSVMQCCTGNAARGLYYGWEGITRCNGDKAQVNLLLNRAAPWLDIDSYLPYEGKVVIKNKTVRRISVRIPYWVNHNKLSCTVNGNNRRLSFTGAYLIIDDLKPEDKVELLFPLIEETFKYTANSKTDEETVYTIKMRGNTVLDISPRDNSPTVYPFYLREYLKSDKAPMKTVIRRIAPIIPRW